MKVELNGAEAILVASALTYAAERNEASGVPRPDDEPTIVNARRGCRELAEEYRLLAERIEATRKAEEGR